MNDKAKRLILLLVLGCVVMAVVDGMIHPGYAVKSLTKVIVFVGLTLRYRRWDKSFLPKALLRIGLKRILLAAAAGVGLYLLIVGSYFAVRCVVDFSRITGAVTSQTGVCRRNFLGVSLYIAFANSFLEEYFFRGFGFLHLKKQAGRRAAYLCSAALFAAYHAPMMIGWCSLALRLLFLAALFAGGLLFNRLDETAESILPSWMIHMFANFGINTVGFLLFAAV